MANTHKIQVGTVPITGTPRYLALRDSPNITEVTEISQISDVQHFWESQGFESFPNNTEVELLEEGLGYQCQWAYVQVGENRGYVYNKDNKYLTLLSGKNYKSLNYECDDTAPIGLPHPQNWTKKSTAKPYYEEVTKKWCVSVEVIDDASLLSLVIRTN